MIVASTSTTFGMMTENLFGEMGGVGNGENTWVQSRLEYIFAVSSLRSTYGP
jgi:hypothetical protein